MYALIVVNYFDYRTALGEVKEKLKDKKLSSQLSQELLPGAWLISLTDDLPVFRNILDTLDHYHLQWRVSMFSEKPFFTPLK